MKGWFQDGITQPVRNGDSAVNIFGQCGHQSSLPAMSQVRYVNPGIVYLLLLKYEPNMQGVWHTGIGTT